MAAHQLPHIIQDLSLILGAAAITTLIFRKLKQPLVLGYIIAGLLVGPQVKIIPTVVDHGSIEIWANIGVIFLLFSLGLEFSFKKLMKVGGTATTTALVEIIVITIAGFFTGRLMGWKLVDCIFLGGMLASSSTTIIIRAFDELKVKSLSFARTVFGVLIVEDIVVILILVLLPTIAISQQIRGGELFFTVLKLVFFLFIWFIAGILLIPSFLRLTRKLIDNETLLILAIGFCFSMVVLAVKTGFSAELGAFIMGSIFAETTKAEKIEHVLSPLKDLFGAIFFVSIGMMIDLNSMWEYIIPIMVVTLVTVLGKFFATTLGAVLSGQTLKHSVQVGMSMAQIGEFAFIIATLGLSLGVTSDFLFPVAVGVAVITTFTTPYMIRYSDKMYTLLERVLPPKVLKLINNYSSYSQTVSGTSQWQRVVKSYFQLILMNTVILLAIVLLSTFYLLPFLEAQTGNALLARILTLIITSIIMLPFIWALTIKKTTEITKYRVIRQNKKYGWAPVLVINLTRFFILILLYGFFLNSVFTSWVALVIILTVMTGVLYLFRGRIQSLYGRMESRFLINLNEREKQQTRRNSITESDIVPIPWDIHLAAFTIYPNAVFAGMSLEDLAWREQFGINIAMIERGDRVIYAPERNDVIFPADKITLIGTDEQLDKIKPLFGTSNFVPDETDDDITIQKIILAEKNMLAGQSIRESNIRVLTNGIVIGIERENNRILNPTSDAVFQPGDTIWLAGNRKMIREFKRRNMDLLQQEK